MANLKINRGTTFIISIIYKKNGVAASLVGATVRFTAKTTEYDSDLTDAGAVIAKNVATGDAEGNAEIVIEPADTATLDPNAEYFYDIKVQDADGSIYKIDEGKIKLDGSPTNRSA